MGCLGSFGLVGIGGALLAVLLGLIGAGGGYWYFSKDLPTVDALQQYTPPTVTVLEDINGVVLGEIYEQRRYVVPTEDIPEHVKLAFMSAEDSNFRNHGGVDYMGMVRAVFRGVLSGDGISGTSTITQQVARNFLLTTDRTIIRKIKEVILSWRIEEAYDKDRILYLYLNEIFLGSQSYGVEAAARSFFGKHISEVTVAEGAILAGLPPAPSAYNPYKAWDKTRVRQDYVIDRMVKNGHLTAEEGAAALAEDVQIMPRGNAFLEQAPYFTEHVRRYLVNQYGEDMVLNGGLKVKTTCDMTLQVKAQEAVYNGVFDVDQRMGFRRSGITNVGADNVDAARAEEEQKLKDAWRAKNDPAKRLDPPPKSIIEPGEVYTAILSDVKKGYAVAAIGAHDAIIPIKWSEWIYEPNPRTSWRKRKARDLTAKVDTDEDGRRDAPILQRGDQVLVKVVALSTKDKEVSSAFGGTPGSGTAYVAARMWQDPEVEAALMSMDVDTGAIRVMVGGSDFRKTEFNRAIQARRQVGSTMKPLVYTAAIESKRVTSATQIADAPLAFETASDFIWKPANFSNEYEGNMTLRQALAKSKNTCTVRILDAADPGMNGDVIYNFGRRLGIGGPPLHTLPDDWIPTPENDVLCPWVRETPKSSICMDRYPPKDASMSDNQHRAQLGGDDKFMCRACDMSMGLGSASLTMEEMVRAYSAFASGGQLVQPYYVEEVQDRDGTILEVHEAQPPVRVMDSAVASIGRWLLQGVVQYGTGVAAKRALGLQGLAGKTGTTNDYKDAWFVGFTNDVITAAWVGYDQPRSLGVSSTGGRTALPIWIEYMKVAAPKSNDRAFPMEGNISYALIDEESGRRVSDGGAQYPFLEGTTPESSGLKEGQISIEDIGIDL